MTLDEAREAWQAARITAIAAFDAVMAPARKRWDKVNAECRQAKCRIPNSDVAAWLRAGQEAKAIYQAIMGAPEADLNKALQQARSTPCCPAPGTTSDQSS